MKNQLFGKELIADLEKSIAGSNETIADRARRIANWETDMDDCFVSEHFNHFNIRQCKMKIEIIKNGGFSEFDVLLDLNGNDTGARQIQTKYGYPYLLPNGGFVNPYVKPKTLLKKGYLLGRAKKAAWVKVRANGNGMAGAMNAANVCFESDVNYATGKCNDADLVSPEKPIIDDDFLELLGYKEQTPKPEPVNLEGHL